MHHRPRDALCIPHAPCCSSLGPNLEQMPRWHCCSEVRELRAAVLPSVTARNFFIGAIIFGEREIKWSRVRARVHTRVSYKLMNAINAEYWRCIDRTVLAKISLGSFWARMVKVSTSTRNWHGEFLILIDARPSFSLAAFSTVGISNIGIFKQIKGSVWLFVACNFFFLFLSTSLYSRRNKVYDMLTQLCLIWL